MKAVVFQYFGGVEVLQIADIETPAPVEGEILVRVRAAAVNPKDTFIRKGFFKNGRERTFPCRAVSIFQGR